VARTVEEFSGLALAEAPNDDSPGVLWETSLALASPLAAGWTGAVRVTVRQRDEWDGSAGVLRGPYSPPQDDGENFRALDAQLSHVVPGRFEGRLSVVWARSEYRATSERRPDVSWVGGSGTHDVPTLDDRELQWSAAVTAWTGGAPERRTWRFDALARAESGAPYTPYDVYNEITLSAVSGLPAGSLHSRRLPWSATLDAAATRVLRAGGIEWDATAALYNVLDRRNVEEVYSGTGLPDDTGWLATEDGQYWLSTSGEQGRSLYELAQHDPSHWQRPRTFTLTLRAAF
jgi:hypothetical protein